MDCLGCGRPLERARDRLLGFSVDVAGDDHVYTYFACGGCGALSVECYHDRFLGDADVTWLGPFPAAVGERVAALLRACPDPHDRWCECPAHRALYTGVPG